MNEEKEVYFDQYCKMSTSLMMTISMESKPQQSLKHLTGHGSCIFIETPIIGSTGF